MFFTFIRGTINSRVDTLNVTSGNTSLENATTVMTIPTALTLNGTTLTKNGGTLTVAGVPVGTGALYGGTVNP